MSDRHPHTPTSRPPRTLGKALGPGLLFAGAAVGVSHLVQSTRAGASFGLALMVFVLAANVFKYPAFQFGPRYAVATGTSLLEGYRRQGRWALVLYGVLTLATMFTVQAAVVIVTAGLLKFLLGTELSVVVVAGGIIALCAGLVAVGSYPLLDAAIKVVVAVLTVTTVVATALAVPLVDWSGPWLPDVASWDPKTVLLVAGLIGWMPSAIDIAVWHSLWALARKNQTGHRPTPREARIDFDIGYVGTTILAFCFVILGAGVMFHGHIAPQEAPVAFAGQIIDLYTTTLARVDPVLADIGGPLIAIAAFGVMFSTSLTVVDGFPRAIGRLVGRFSGPEEPDRVAPEPRERRAYWGAVGLLAVGSLVIIGVFAKSLVDLVAIATLLSFLTAPALAFLNHRAMFAPEVPADYRPGRGMRAFSLAGVAFNTLVALYYVYAVLQ
ncbi:MAG: divalent metal cation transporter [Myxococcales bacterium]|nr:divalent metal cation transporter [Myxococcales bacterium]MCB9732065.1 divalent metal cation transporter [Deltaproteobacteria bacterium]